jgi:hypothetical protein
LDLSKGGGAEGVRIGFSIDLLELFLNSGLVLAVLDALLTVGT